MFTVGDRGTLLIGQEDYGKELAEVVCTMLEEKGIHADIEIMKKSGEEVRMDVKRFMKV